MLACCSEHITEDDYIFKEIENLESHTCESDIYIYTCDKILIIEKHYTLINIFLFFINF